MDNCNFCPQSEAMQKNLVVSKGEKIYLILPSEKTITEGHCILAPLRHVGCAALLNEEEQEELNVFKEKVTKMFAFLMKKNVIFYETAIYEQGSTHMQIHCVPLSSTECVLAVDIFDKVFNESARLTSYKEIDLNTDGPKIMNYFSISFGVCDSSVLYPAVYPITDMFPKNFAETVFEHSLGLRKRLWNQTIDNQCKRVSMFKRNWYGFDPA